MLNFDGKFDRAWPVLGTYRLHPATEEQEILLAVVPMTVFYPFECRWGMTVLFGRRYNAGLTIFRSIGN